MVVEQKHPVLGKVHLANLSSRFSGCDTTITAAAPLLGQHNRDVAVERGYSSGEIDTMIADGVLYAEAAVAGSG